MAKNKHEEADNAKLSAIASSYHSGDVNGAVNGTARMVAVVVSHRGWQDQWLVAEVNSLRRQYGAERMDAAMKSALKDRGVAKADIEAMPQAPIPAPSAAVAAAPEPADDDIPFD